MTLFLAWIVFPIVLGLLSLGCGLLLETVSGMRLPGALLLPGGFIVISVAVYFAHMTNGTAVLQTPLVIGLAIAGYVLSPPWKRFQFDGWLTGAAVGVYGVFAAPVVLSGAATFAGYTRLDDTATFLSFLDRAARFTYGGLTNLDPSTYKSTLLQEGYKYGYPLGSMLPIDVGHTLLRVDQAWLWQPYITFMAALTALGLYQLVSGFVQSRALRACVAFVGAQAALLYGYAMWGGIKEMFAPSVVLFAVCLVPRVKTGTPRQVIPLGVASAALLGALSVGGGIWLVPVMVAGVTLLIVYRSTEDLLKTAGIYAVTTLVLAFPIEYVSKSRLKVLGKFANGGKEGSGNLNHPVSWWHLFGIWPSGDFRTRPSDPTLTHLLAALVAIAAIFAVVIAWRRARWEIVVALATGVVACLFYVEGATPWVAGKALASASPLILGVGLAGVAVVIESGRRIEGGVVLTAIALAVLWSTTTQYHGVLLAPAARLMELQKIGEKFSGQGPTLLTDFEVYGSRHFLRALDPQTVSGLRYDTIPLRHSTFYCPDGTKSGGGACNGVSPDLDEIKLGTVSDKNPVTAGLLHFKTLITRRTGVASRPPSGYSLVPGWSGRYYDVWRRNPGASRIISHISLGSRLQPAAVPDCKAVMQLAAKASAAHGVLATVYRPEAIVLNKFGQNIVPKHFYSYGEPAGLVNKTNKFRLNLPFTVRKDGTYGVWVGGSFSSALTAAIDGRRVGQQRNQTEWPGNFLNFGSAHLAPGQHMLVIKHSGPDWRPGSAATQPFGLGPFVIAQGTDDRNVTIVKPSKARSLCGKSLDWIEALRGS
jgi:hypothetical protein